MADPLILFCEAETEVVAEVENLRTLSTDFLVRVLLHRCGKEISEGFVIVSVKH